MHSNSQMLPKIFQIRYNCNWVIVVALLLPIAIYNYVLYYDKVQQLPLLNVPPVDFMINVRYKQLEHLASKPDTFLHSTKNGPKERNNQQSVLSTEQTKEKQVSYQQQNSKQPVNQPAKVDKQQSNLPTKKLEQMQSMDKQDSKQKKNSENQSVKIDQDLLSLSKKKSKFKDYITKNLSSSQVEGLLQWMGVNNLTSRKAQNQFLTCGGMLTLRRLKGPDPQTPLPVIPSHQRCKNMSFKNSGPLVTLSSFPGSGNSWVRQLLESATGIYTGALWCDEAYASNGMIGEFVQSNNVIAVKAHHYIPSVTKKKLNNDKSIYIVRSPFGAILAEHTRSTLQSKRNAENHVIEVDFEYDNNSKWERYVKNQSLAWKNEVRQWLSYKQYPILIIGYENLQRNTHKELKKMLDFLGRSYTEDDILCAVKSSEDFHRKHTKKDVHPYSPKLQKFVLNEIEQVDAALLTHNISLYHPYGSKDF